MARGEYVVKESGLEFRHIPRKSNAGDENASDDDDEDLLVRFRRDFRMNILEQRENELVVELIHVDTSFVNALRRILLAEVPTVAIESVYIMDNTSILHDEVLAHRLGLVPLNVDARLLEEVDDGEEWTPTDRNTLVFTMQVSCGRRPAKVPPGGGGEPGDDDDPEEAVHGDPELEEAARLGAAEGAADADGSHRAPPPCVYPKDRPYTKHVYSSDLKWAPQGDQLTFLGGDVGALVPDILLAKLRPGQAVSLEAHARRGVGKDHAKFSPVATASYRLMPRVELLEPVYDDAADELVHVYEPGVFELVPADVRAGDPPEARRRARVCNPYASTMSRNYLRHPELADKIRMTRIPDHFILSIESVGSYDPGVLLAEAVRVLQGKCRRVIDLAEDTKQLEL